VKVGEQDDEDGLIELDDQTINPSSGTQDTTSRNPIQSHLEGSVPIPPYPKRLCIDKIPTSPEFYFLGELRNVWDKIPLFQAIKDVPIYVKAIQELFLRKPRRKKKDPKTIHVIMKLVDLMLGKNFMDKYADPGSPVVSININNTSIPNTLIDLGETINVMTKETMEKLKLPGLCSTPIVL
jgi:hypothetical protein